MAENIQPDNNEDVLLKQAIQKNNLDQGRPLDYDPLASLNTTRMAQISPVPTEPILYKKNFVGNIYTGPNPQERKDDPNVLARLSTVDHAKNTSRAIKQSAIDNLDADLLARPYSFNADADGARFARYYNHPKYTSLGFNPYHNNEDLYNKNSTFGDEFSRASGQWLRLVGEGFSSGLRSWGIGGGITPQADIIGAKNMAEAIDIGSSSKGGFGGWATNTWLNSGLSIGIGAEWLAEELVLSTAIGASGGLLAPELLPVAGARATRAFGLLGKNYERGANLGSQLRNIQNIQEAKSYWDATRTRKILKGAFNIANPIGNTMQSLKGIKYANKEYAALHALNTFGGFARDWIELKAAVNESNLEGGLVKLDVEKKLIEKYRAENDGKFPMGEAMKKISETADAEAYTTALNNIPVIFASNNILYETLFKFIKPKYTPAVGDVIRKEAAGTVVLEKSGFKLYDTRLGRIKASGKALLKPKTHFKYMGAYMKANLAEGLQENIQESISEGAINHAIDLYNNDYKYANQTFASHVLDGLKGQFSQKGFETFASGFVTGAISQPIMSAPFATLRMAGDWTINRKKANEYKATRNKQLKSLVESLNKSLEDPLKLFAPEFRNLGAQGKIAQDYLEALANGDVKGQIDAKKSAQIEATLNALYSNGYDALLTKFKDGYLKLADEDLVQAFNRDRKDGEKMFNLEDVPALRSQLNSIVERATKVKERFDWVQENLPNPYEYNIYKEGTEAFEAMRDAHAGWNEMQKSLILGWATYDSNVKRISSIYNDLSSAGAVLSKIRGYDVNLLLSPETRLKEIALLDSEIETLEGNTDAESKKQLEFKKELKDKLLNFHILFADAENRSLYDEEGKTIMSEDLKSKGITLMKTSKDAERNADGTYANGNPVIIKSEGETPLVHIITGIDEETGEYEISRQYTDENGEIQIDSKFVSENDFEILSEESLSEIHKVSHTNEMKQAFVDYIKLFANKNNEIATNDKIDQAFQKIIDYILINKENVNLVKNINFMANPQQMAELSGRFIKAYKSKKAKMRMQMIDSINKIIQKYEWNSALLELYKKGFWVSEKDINRIVAEINSNKPVSDPETFIDVNTYEEVPKDSDKYKKALDIWKAQKEMIVDSFKNYLKQEKKKKHTIVENADKTFSVISPEGTVVGGPLATKEDAEKIASALDEALEAEEKAVADDKKKKIRIVAGDTDWWNKYNDDPDVLRLKDSILTKLAELTDQNKEDISDDEVYNFLQGSTAALSIINMWNAAREKEGLVKAPELKASNPPKPLEEMSLKDLEDFVSLLENISNKTPDTISDIAEIRAYIGKRKGQTLVKPNTKEQEKAIAKLKEAQADIANKNDNSKNYIIHNELYDRVTNVVPKIVVDTFGYTFSKNEDNTYSLINYKGEKVGAPFGEYTDDETGKFVTAEENVKKEVNILNSVLKFSNFLDKKPFIQNKIESFVNDLVSQINENKITKEEAIEKLFETLFIDSNNYKNGILFELFNENKIKEIKGKLLNQDFTFNNVKTAFNEYAYNHASIRGNYVDKHVRDFFTNFELGVKPAYFTEEAWTNLGNALIAIRDTLVKQGFNVIANDLTVYDRESKIAGTLDLLLVDAKGNYYIYDIKTGDAKKWNDYAKPSGILPASQAMVENTFQLSLYSNLLQNITGIQTKGLAIFALETTEDLDGNILTLNAVNNNKAIPIKYDLGIAPSPSQKVVPIRAFEKSEVPTTDLPQATEVTSVNVLAEQQLKYLNQYLSNLESKWEEYGKEIDVIDRSIIEQNKQIAAIKSQQSDLGAFLENASEKELKGKKRKIKAQIKELEESLTKAEANLESLLAAKEKIIIDNSKLENFIYVTKDAIKSVESGQIQKKFNMQEYLNETLANLNNRYLDTLVKLENRIEVTQDTISKLREVLMSMGITAELIDAALTNTDILPLLRSKVNEIKLKYFDTREAKKIDKYRGKIQEEYQAEVAPYIELINKLSKKQFKDFKSAYIESIKLLRAQTDKLLKLREDYDNLYNMKETVDSPFNFSAQAKRELLTAISYLENSISILNEAQKVKETKALEEKKAKAPAKPAAKKEPAKKATPTRKEVVEEKVEVSDIEKQKEKVKEELLNKKVKTKTGLVLRIIDVKLDAAADNIILYYVSEADNKHNNISYPDFNNALEDGRIIFIAEKTEVAKPVKKEVKKELVLSQDEINNIAQENKKIINVPEQDSVESGEVVAAVINPANGKATPTNSKFKVINLGFIKIIDTTMSPEVVLYGNHVGELRSVGINSGYDEQMDVTSIDGNEYALAEGYASWSDFYFENKKAIDKIAKNESKRVVLIVKPIGIKTKARVPKGEKDLLSEYGFTDPVINAMSDSELAEAIEAAKNQDAGILNMILFRYEKLILPESKTVEEVESEMNNLFTKIMAPEFLDDITDFKNYFDDLLVEISNNINYLIGNNAAERIENLYKDLESKIKDKPLFKNIMKNDVVTIDNTEYVAEKISVDSITFAMLGDVTVKLKIKEDEIPTKVQSISEPIGKVFEEEKVNVTSNEKDLITASAINEKQLEVTNAILQYKNENQAKENSNFKKTCP